MEKTWSFYRVDDGSFVGATFTGREEDLPLNIPAGCGAIEGAHDALSKRVVDGAVQDWIPPKPPDTDHLTHVWLPAAMHWLPVPTQAAFDAHRQANVKAEIVAMEAQQARPLREFAIARDSAAMAAAMTKLAELDAQIAAKRAELEARPAAMGHPSYTAPGQEVAP